MNELRWILAVAGLLLLAWIYWQGRRKRFTSTKQGESSQLLEPTYTREPHIESSPILTRDSRLGIDLPEVRIIPASAPLSMDDALSTSALDRLTLTQPLRARNEAQAPILTEERPSSTPVPPPAPKPPAKPARKMIVLRVPAGARLMEGLRLQAALVAQGLKHGRYGIYHRSDTTGGTMFSVASMVEPGTFDLAAMPRTEYPGISLFMQLPGTSDGLVAFEAMLTCAQSIQQEFQGGLHGERGKPLTTEAIARIREEIADFQHLVPPITISG